MRERHRRRRVGRHRGKHFKKGWEVRNGGMGGQGECGLKKLR